MLLHVLIQVEGAAFERRFLMAASADGLVRVYLLSPPGDPGVVELWGRASKILRIIDRKKIRDHVADLGVCLVEHAQEPLFLHITTSRWQGCRGTLGALRALQATLPRLQQHAGIWMPPSVLSSLLACSMLALWTAVWASGLPRVPFLQNCLVTQHQ